MTTTALRRLGAAVFLVAACAAGPVLADREPLGVTFGAHLYSLHAPRLEQRSLTTGLYLRDGAWTAGAYSNSIGRLSLYVTRAWRIAGLVELHAGLVTGYQRRQVTVPCARVAARLGLAPEQVAMTDAERGFACWEAVGHGRYAVSPLVTLSAALPRVGGVTPRLTYLPRLDLGGLAVSRSHVLHVSIEGEF